MAEKLMKEHLYGDLLAPTPGYYTDFALGMTYSLSFEAMLTAYMAFGMLGEMNDNAIESPHLLLDAITKSCDRIVVLCNKGGIAVPPTIRKVFSLMERNIFEVFDKKNPKANFHPKLWLIREINNDSKEDKLLKLVVTSRNLAYTDTIDCIACLTGKVSEEPIDNEKHKRLVDFIKCVVENSNTGKSQKNIVQGLVDDLLRVKKFDVDEPFEDYDFFPYLFDYDFGVEPIEKYLIGKESIIVSPFIDKGLLNRLSPNTLITRKEYVDKDIFDKISKIYVALDDLACRGMDLHAKMYYVFNGRNHKYLYLGSANATNSAFTRNGEFLLGLKYKSGNSRSEQFLGNFYEKDNKDNKFMPLIEPLENASSCIEWDKAEESMKILMCAEDLKAKIIPHRKGEYSVVVTSKTKKLDNDVYISPLQKDYKQKWTGKVKFENMKADELSEFYILSATSTDGKQHKAIIKIETESLPQCRDSEIYKGIIKSEKDFFHFLEYMLTDTPLRHYSNEILQKEHGVNGSGTTENNEYPNLYEKMLKVVATNPEQFRKIEQLVNKLDAVVPDKFKKMYKLFVSALN